MGHNYRDTESLEVVQALGIDLDGGSVTLSAATGADASGREPLRIKASGESMEARHARPGGRGRGGGASFSPARGPWCWGEAAAAETARWLDGVARSRELRLDTELYVLRGAEAAELVAGSNGPEDVFAALDALAGRMERSGTGRTPTCADVSRSLAESGAAAASAVRLEDGKIPARGLRRADKLRPRALPPRMRRRWGRRSSSAGTGEAEVRLAGGVVCVLSGAELALEPVWAGDGSLARLEVSVSARGSVVEAPPDAALSSATDWSRLGRELGEAAAGWAEAALGECVSSGADFLGLGRTLAARCPGKGRRPAGGLARLAALFRQRRGQNTQYARVRRLALRGGGRNEGAHAPAIAGPRLCCAPEPRHAAPAGHGGAQGVPRGLALPDTRPAALRARERRNIPRAAL